MGTHSSPVDSANKVSSPQWRLQILPVHCLTLQYGYSSSPVHQGNKRGEADGSCRRHQYSPVYRRLANEHKLKAARYHPLVGASCRSLGWITNFKRSDLFPTLVINLLLQFDLRVGLVFSIQRKLIERRLPCWKVSLISREAQVTLKAWFQWRRLYHWVICT